MVVSLIFISAVNAQEEQTTEKKGFFWNIIQKIKSFFRFGAEKEQTEEIETEQDEEEIKIAEDEDTEATSELQEKITSDDVQDNNDITEDNTIKDEDSAETEEKRVLIPESPGIEEEWPEEEFEKYLEEEREKERAWLESMGVPDEEIERQLEAWERQERAGYTDTPLDESEDEPSEEEP